MYASKDRMFFELIQNADDAASENGVIVYIETLGDYLVIRHNGKSFDKDDFYAITSSANGTKKANENKTGYKGIGFKSVFTDSEKVFIKTGGYQFKFDRNDERFTDFDKFYFYVNDINTEEKKQIFIQKFNKERSEFKGVIDIPWQLEPIWVDNFSEELGTKFTQSNVSIALKLGETKISGDGGYGQVIIDIIRNPHFMLFLRNTKRIDFNGLSVSKDKKNNIITLKSSFGDIRVEYFKREDFEIEVNNAIFEENNIDIRIKIEEQDEKSGTIVKAKFVDTHNVAIESIPEKIAINNSTSISFAVPITKEGFILPDKQCSDISMFAFLPTLVKDFKFPFYINANFILDSPRQRILGDNPWNFYLMQEIAKRIVNWCASLNKKQDKNALNILITKYFEENISDTKQLAEHFNSAYKTALQSEAFILNHKGELSKQNEIIIDKTGLSEIVGEDLFCQIIEKDKCLPSKSIDYEILKESIFEYVELLGFKDVIKSITDNSMFNAWYISASIEQKNKLYKWIENNNIYTYKDDLKTFVSNLPLFQFGEDYKTLNEVKSANYIITTEHINKIKNILIKLGFICSDNVFDKEHSLYKYISLPEDKELFNAIKGCEFSELDAEERKCLFLTLTDFREIGDTKLKKEIALFKNIKGEFKPLGDMIRYRENTPIWLYDYVLCKEDNDTDLIKYLIYPKDEFEDIVQKHYGEFDASIIELYNVYKDEWTGLFTRNIIDSIKIDNDILTIIEESDTKTKEYFLNSLNKLELSSTSYYNRDSYEYRVLQLVLSVYNEPSDFSSKIFYDNKCIRDFSVSDDVVCEFLQDSKKKNVKMSLTKLLPQYQNQTESIEQIKEHFESKRDLDKFFVAKPKRLYDIHVELNNLLGIPERVFSEWNIEGNAYQYLFATYYRVHEKSWNNSYVPNIELNNQTEEFVNDILSFLYDNNISIEESPFTHHLRKYFRGKYFYSDYLLENERLVPIIEKWVNEEGKIKYLLKNGVKKSDSQNIQFRNLFLENKPIDFLGELSNDDLKSGIKFIATVNGFTRPFIGDNQKTVLLAIKNKNIDLSSNLNIDYIKEKSKEWDTKEYIEWKNNNVPHIFIYPGVLPCLLSYNNEVLLNYDNTEQNYYYDRKEQKLFINNVKNINDILFEFAKEGKYGFNIVNYKQLCWSGTEEELEEQKKTLKEKDKTIETLKAELEQYKRKYGELSNKENNIGQKPMQPQTSNTIKKLQEDVDTPNGVIEKGDLSMEQQIDAHEEAERIIRTILENEGFDLSNWIGEEDYDYTNWNSVNKIPDIIKS
ncbi:MAG: ATP-binding protein [Clostridia bacterium]|nr:ATP-binding protein [Bacteroidales bacterium]MBR1654762.1 ATP-binding protein [Clostridia bacterium]